MTREEWKNDFKGFINELSMPRDDYNGIMNYIDEAPNETRWISVSEKLPEINQRVLVTSYGRVCYAMMISADGNSGYPIFKLQDSLNERVVCETTVHSEFTTSRIKAWMPLPQPFEPQKSEVQDAESEVQDADRD